MKSVLISIRPKWVDKIASGKKTIEVRKTAPKKVPFKAYIYCTSQKFDGEILLTADKKVERRYKHCRDNGDIPLTGKVIGEFICDKIDEYKFHEGLTEFNSMGLPSRIYGSYLIFADDYKAMCLSYDEVKNYGKHKTLYGWHISDLKIYDKPKELSEFYRPCSYSGICYSCNRFRPNGTPNDKPNDFCDGEITRPPQSWQYVKELKC